MPRPVAARRALVLLLTMLLALFAVLTVQRLIGDGEASAIAKGPGAGAGMVTKTYRLTRADQPQRLTVGCPGRSVPLGGGMTTNPAPGPGGEGVYPHSYERLGRQRGWHVTAVLFDPTHGATTPRDVTLQVVCGQKKRLGHFTPPHTTVRLRPGQTKTAVARCPGRRHLIGGGFQRTDFTSQGGDYVTESRAISPKAWRVTGHAFGAYGGELTAIAYCLHSRRPLVTEVWTWTQLAPHSLGTAQTQSCPPGRRLVFGGFSTDPPGSAFFTNGVMNPDGTWSASGFNDTAAPSNLTAYGYCLRQ
jgi:hypothetical protein